MTFTRTRHEYRSVPEPTQVCACPANSPSNLAASDQPSAKCNSAPEEASARRSLSMLREQLKPHSGGVSLGSNGIVIKSHRGSDAEGFADAITFGYKMVLQELHSEIKQTLASAVRRRGHKRRTLWLGVTTRLGQP